MWEELLKFLSNPYNRMTFEDSLASIAGVRVPVRGMPPSELEYIREGYTTPNDPLVLGEWVDPLPGRREAGMENEKPGVYVHPRIRQNKQAPSVEDNYYNSASRQVAPLGYIVGHEYGHGAYARNQGPAIKIGDNEKYAAAFGDAINLLRATASPQNRTFGPEVPAALDRLAPGTKDVFHWLLMQPMYADHPLRGWGRYTYTHQVMKDGTVVGR